MSEAGSMALVQNRHPGATAALAVFTLLCLTAPGFAQSGQAQPSQAQPSQAQPGAR